MRKLSSWNWKRGGCTLYPGVCSMNSLTADTVHMLERDLAMVTRAVYRNGSVFIFLMQTLMCRGLLISGSKVMFWRVKWMLWWKRPLLVSSLHLKKLKKARVNAAQSITASTSSEW